MKIFIGKENSCNLNYMRDLLYSEFIINGHEIVKEPEDADIIIFPDTCCCTEYNLQYTLFYINDILSRKKENAKTFLTGCITRKFTHNPENFDVNEWLNNNIDYIFPQNNNYEILKTIFKKEFEDYPYNDFGYSRPLNDETAEMYISNGCMNNCSFCKLTFQKYPLKSVDINEVKESIDRIDELGFKELDIKGTNISQYGYDLYKEYKLPEIIEYIENKNNINKVRYIGFSYKDAIKNNFAPVIRDSKKTDTLGGSLESGSNRLLKLIRKGFTKEEFLSFIYEIRKKYPKNLRLNVISGFPTETIEDILETIAVLDEVKPLGIDLCRYTNSSIIDSNNYPQLSPEEIQEHTRIYEKILRKKNIQTDIVGDGYNYN